MKHTVTLIRTTVHVATVEVEADNEAEAKKKAEQVEYTTTLDFRKKSEDLIVGAVNPVGSDGFRVDIDVNEAGDGGDAGKAYGN